MKQGMSVRFGFILFLALGSWLTVADSLAGGMVVEGNRGRDGETLDLKTLITRGKITLVDFWSPYCEPCLKMAPIMEKLAEKRPDLRVVKLNINRSGVQGIDWKSPLAQQYNIRSIPHLVIFGKDGKQIADGHNAFKLFLDWARQEGL